MKKTIALLLFLCTFSVAKSQISPADSTVQFVSYWINNDTITYHFTQDKYKINARDTLQRETQSYDVHITVLDSTDKGYKLKWTYQNFNINTQNPFLKKLSGLTNNMSIIYSTNELGVFNQIENTEEVQHYIDVALDTLRSSFSTIPNINQLLTNVRGMFDTREKMEAYCIEEIKMFHYPYGTKFKQNEVVTADDELPNVWGGDPLKAKLELAVISTDTINNSAILKATTTANPEDCKRIAIQVINQMLQGLNIPKPKESDIPKVEIQDLLATNIHTDSGWVLDAYKLQEIKCGEITQVKVMEISIK